MIRDPIVDEVRAIREALAAPFNFDIRKIVEDAQRRQGVSPSRVVSFQKSSQTLQPTEATILVSPGTTSSEASPAGSP